MTGQTCVEDWDSFAKRTRRKQDHTGSWKRGSVQELVLAQGTCSVLGELAGEQELNRADCRRRVV